MLLATDRQLLDAFRRGDREALARVFHHYADCIAGFLMHGFVFQSGGQTMRCGGLGSRYEIHDLLGETFRRSFEESARRSYDGLGSYEAFLKTIARHLVLDRLRADRVRAELRPDYEGDDALPTPEQELERAQLGRLMAAYRAQLTLEEQRLLALRFEDGVSQELTAEALGCRRKRVRRLEADLRRRLLRHLRGSGYLTGVS